TGCPGNSGRRRGSDFGGGGVGSDVTTSAGGEAIGTCGEPVRGTLRVWTTVVFPGELRTEVAGGGSSPPNPRMPQPENGSDRASSTSTAARGGRIRPARFPAMTDA